MSGDREHTHLPGEFDPRCGVCIDQAADEVARRGLGVEAALTNADQGAAYRYGVTGGHAVPTRPYGGDFTFAEPTADPASPELIVLTDEQEHQAARYLQDQTAIASIGLCRTFVRGLVKRVNEVREAGL